LRRSRFLEARELLERRGLVVVEQAGTGRGRASTLWLAFAETGPWWDGDQRGAVRDSAQLQPPRGAARLLLAAAAALADEQEVLEGVTTRELCAAAGLSDTTYRRARSALLASGELVLVSGHGGRGKANCWEIADPRACAGEIAPVGRQRVAPPAGQRPLVASVSSAAAPAAPELPGSEIEAVDSRGEHRVVQTGKGGGDRTLSAQNCPAGAGVLVGKGAAERTLSPETPPKPRRKPRHPTRAREGNPRTPEPFPPAPRGGWR
jgi:hypothetical protein